MKNTDSSFNFPQRLQLVCPLLQQEQGDSFLSFLSLLMLVFHSSDNNEITASEAFHSRQTPHGLFVVSASFLRTARAADVVVWCVFFVAALLLMLYVVEYLIFFLSRFVGRLLASHMVRVDTLGKRGLTGWRVLKATIYTILP